MTSFIVEGTGMFPHDMLRYDRCWPASSNDAANLAWDEGEMPLERRQIELEFQHMNHFDQRPTAARWLRFGWRVVAHAVARPASAEAKRELDHRGRRG